LRFPEDQIKEAILHPDPEIRDRATRYFSNSYSSDPSIMAQVIKSVGIHGRQDAFHQIGASRHLRQTEESIAWVIDELNDERSNDYENYTYNLSMILIHADPRLLLPRESAILEARHFLEFLSPAFSERLRMLSWDEATCWRELEEFCEASKDEQSTSEVALEHARRIVEALARHGKGCEEKAHALLTHWGEEGGQGAWGWMQPLVVRLAGEARLESTIPLLVTHLRADRGDLDNEECAESLARIGTPAVLDAVAEVYPHADSHFHLYANKPLETIHSDLAVETCLRLLDQEKDERAQQQLAYALLALFAEEGIEVARRLLLGREIDFDNRDVWDALLATCTITGARFPEYDEWMARDRRETEAHRRKIKELEGDPTRLMAYAMGKLAGKADAELDQLLQRPPMSPAPRPAPSPAGGLKQKTGRNERCPCGSGKKFKHCCGGH
jgi:SEC-C motif